jgi:hypothetical protein
LRTVVDWPFDMSFSFAEKAKKTVNVAEMSHGTNYWFLIGYIGDT